MPRLIPGQTLQLQNVAAPEWVTQFQPQPTEQQIYNSYQPEPLQTINADELASQEWFRQNQPIDEFEAMMGVPRIMDWATGAPARGFLQASAEGDNVLSALGKGLATYGRPPEEAPTGSQIAETMGVSQRPLSDFAAGWEGIPTTAKLTDMVGLGIEGAADMTPLMGMMLPASKVFHGSPHKFNKFDLSKIGTGEGAQAFGHGLYVTDSKGIAEDYAKNLSKKDYKIGEEYDFDLDRGYYTKDKPNEFYSNERDVKDILESKEQGLFYTSKIPEGEYLVWDKDIIPKDAERVKKSLKDIKNTYKQEEIVSEGLKTDPSLPFDPIKFIERTPSKNEIAIGKQMDEFVSKRTFGGRELLPEQLDEIERIFSDTWGMRGEGAYKRLEKVIGSPEATSEFLNRAGFQGIQYPAGSLSGVTDSKAKNYVLFSDKDLPISEIKNLSTGELQKLD